MTYRISSEELANQEIEWHVPSIVTMTIGGLVSLLSRLHAISRDIDLRLQRQATRRMLGGLSDHELKDIGLTRGDARHEAARKWWD